jgi:hypothetical protein
MQVESGGPFSKKMQKKGSLKRREGKINSGREFTYSKSGALVSQRKDKIILELSQKIR